MQVSRALVRTIFAILKMSSDKNLRIVVNNLPASRPREGPPHRLSDIADARFDLLLDAPVARDGREDASAAVARRVDQHGAVRRIARRLVELPAAAQHLDQAVAPQIGGGDPKVALSLIAA